MTENNTTDMKAVVSSPSLRAANGCSSHQVDVIVTWKLIAASGKTTVCFIVPATLV